MAESSTLARPYARAAFDHALSRQDLSGWSRQLNLLAYLVAEPRVSAIFRSPSVSADEQANLLIQLAGDELTEPVRNFLHILSENKRLVLLPEILAQFEQHKANQEKSVDVEVATAYPLDDALIERLAAALKGTLQRDVSLNTVIDQSLLGGILVRAGDLVIDGSVRGRLAKLAGAMNS